MPRKGFEGEGGSLRRLRDSPKISEISFVETRIAELVLGILESLEKVLDN